MGELAIRRNRGFAIPQYRGKAEKTSGSSESRKAAGTTVTVSETLKQLLTKVSQAESQIRESRRTLQAGEGVLAEVRDSLERIAKLAEQSAQGGEAGRDALQAELEQLLEDIDRMIGSAAAGDTPLFLDGEMGGEDGWKTLLYAVLEEPSAQGGAAQDIPSWLVQSITQDAPDAEELLAALGLDKTASGSEILAAILNRPLEGGSAAGYLASLYLGAVIASGSPPGQVDPLEALEGLRLLLEKVSEGVPLDQAVELLTEGEFTSLEDFQTQFTGGTAPGLENFLANLLLSESTALLPAGSPGLALLAGMEGMKLELVLGLLTAAQESGTDTEPAAAAQAPAVGAQTTAKQTPTDAQAADTVQASRQAGRQQPTVMEFGPIRVLGHDLSQVSFDKSANELTVGGDQEVILQKGSPEAGQEAGSVVIAGNGKVTLLGVNLSALTVSAPAARLFSAGGSMLGTVNLREGASLTLDANGLLKAGGFHAEKSSSLRLTGGAVALVEGKDLAASHAVTAPVLIEGPASFAARALSVTGPDGKALEPFDLVWKTLLPGWHGAASMALDGHQTKMALMNGDPVRLWMSKGDATHGFTIHTLAVRGRDEFGRPQTRYAYLLWNQNTRSFEEISMYPNPFLVTGGEMGKDWVYEEESHTLHILSAQVTAVSGGTGTDYNQTPFSGRIALADGIGGIELALNGVICRVSSGRAFDLGQGNDVTLILHSGTANFFESGAGCAGISLGNGTSLSISCTSPDHEGEAVGALCAAGSGGGAGIGRDSVKSRDQSSCILIRSGVIQAAGSGGGAGIGAGKYGAIGTITILGGEITSSGKSGGAGIGAALGAPAGDISIQGGKVTATAVCHAAAIGAGVQGTCGDILIAGSARIVKALGGDPGADIGACLFGGCGNVRISAGADIGTARLRTQAGIPLRMGEDTVTLPQFRLSVRTLGLDQLSISTREEAKEAKVTIEADRRWISQIQEAYSALYHRMARSVSSLRGVRQYIGSSERIVRDTASASSLMDDMRQSILLQPGQAVGLHNKRGKEDVQDLLR